MTEEVEDMKGKVLEEVENTKANVLEELQTRLKDLYSELHLTKNALTNALSKLAAKDRQIDRSDKYNESLRTEIESLSLQIEGYRSAQTNRQDAQVQTNAEEILTAMAEKPFPAWNAELKQSEPATDAALSIEETLKATAEAALQQTGFVYDENTRLYYDYNSGYYYDGEQSLYYDPTCGTYFYYDEITGEYTFHSQIDAKTFRQYNHLIKKAQSEATREMGDRTDGKISDGSSTDIQTKTSLTSGTADRRDLVKKNKELDKNRKKTDKRRKETDKRRKKPKDDETHTKTMSRKSSVGKCDDDDDVETHSLRKTMSRKSSVGKCDDDDDVETHSHRKTMSRKSSDGTCNDDGEAQTCRKSFTDKCDDEFGSHNQRKTMLIKSSDDKCDSFEANAPGERKIKICKTEDENQAGDLLQYDADDGRHAELRHNREEIKKCTQKHRRHSKHPLLENDASRYKENIHSFKDSRLYDFDEHLQQCSVVNCEGNPCVNTSERTVANNSSETLQQNVCEMHNTIKTLQQNVCETHNTMKTLQQNVCEIHNTMEQNVCETHNTMETLQQNVCQMKNTMKTLQQNVCQMQNTMKTLQQNVCQMQNTMKTLQQDNISACDTNSGREHSREKNVCHRIASSYSCMNGSGSASSCSEENVCDRNSACSNVSSVLRRKRDREKENMSEDRIDCKRKKHRKRSRDERHTKHSHKKHKRDKIERSLEGDAQSSKRSRTPEDTMLGIDSVVGDVQDKDVVGDVQDKDVVGDVQDKDVVGDSQDKDVGDSQDKDVVGDAQDKDVKKKYQKKKKHKHHKHNSHKKHKKERKEKPINVRRTNKTDVINNGKETGAVRNSSQQENDPLPVTEHAEMTEGLDADWSERDSDVVVVSDEDLIAVDDDAEQCLDDHHNKEPGELSADSSQDSDWSIEDRDDLRDVVSNADLPPAVAANWPPCIRAIVEQSDCLSVGTLFIVTCTSGSIGREKSMNHAITIPDINVSKIHAELRFDYNRRCYVLTDKGSQNGTLLNWERVSQSEGESSGSSVKHGDIVQLGSTSLLLHIHQGMDTCDACEPGQVMAQFHKTNKPEIVVMSKKDRMRARREELNQIKMKYGLKNCAYVDNAAAIHNPAYADKSHIRRQTVGSDVPDGKTEAPASVYRPISEENKGHKLLAKMGWKEGQGLGRDNAGMSEPINIMLRGNQCAGLGSGAAVNTSLDNVDSVHRSKRWLQAQQRYDNLGKRDNSNNNKKSLPIQFSFEKSKTMDCNVKQRPTVFPVDAEDDAAS